MADVARIQVLLVDDTEISAYSKQRILERAGFEVTLATNGTDALRLVQERMPRIVLLDVALPDIDGWEVCRRIKGDPATASVLVLQMSATFVSEADTVRALDGGADACLTEPFEPPVLVATVRALLRAREAEDALRDALVRAEEARASAEAANRTKDEFLAMLSHELRTPLGTILTSVTLLRSGKIAPEPAARALEMIERNARLQVKLIDDLLDVSRIMSGKLALDIDLVDVSSVVEAALDQIGPAAQARRLALEVTIAPDLPPLRGDPARLQQVVWNVLSNAVKFTPPGGRIELFVERSGAFTEIRITDTGKGIEPDFLSRVFERFEQVDSSTTRSEGGLGLGLAIVRHLVELHGGTVRAESEGLGRGTTFVICLPVAEGIADGERPGRRAPATSSRDDAARLDGVRVLAVDDEIDSLKAITLVLEHRGATVREARSVAEAVAALADELPDVIVSDIGMPREDGYELVRHVRSAHHERLADLPVLALTAYGTPVERRRILQRGFQACLAKPVDADELVGAVARLARSR